jgi:DNA/RNA-binding protein KIN17
MKAKEEEELLVALDKRNKKDYWLQKNIVVKVMNKKLKDGLFYKEKAVVLDVIDNYTGEIKIISTGKILRIDQVSALC